MCRMIVCSFSALDEIPRKLKGQAYQDAVLALLKKTGRFSSFEVDQKLGRCLEDLKLLGKIKIDTSDYKYHFPWVGVEVLDKEPS